MEAVSLKLTEAEQRYFGELFSCCDIENQGKISGTKASELFLASQLPTETLHQLGHFGRSQFYIALKLIAAAQTGLPVKLEILNSSMEVPLPKFGRGNDSVNFGITEGSRQSGQIPGQLPPPPTKGYRGSIGSAHRQSSLKSDVETSPSHQAQPIFQSNTQIQAVSDSHGSSPTEVPSSPRSSDLMHGDKSWAAFQQDGHLNWAQFEEHHHLLGNEEDSSERHSSDEEYDFWTLTDEQKEYYTNQFKQMQSDLKGRISGAAAKEFFEKSKLPVHELSKIWQLSDIDKDGALTIEEFCTAMHLVVLRRNNIDLPDVLPPSLVPRIPQRVPEENRTYPTTQHQQQYQSVGSPKQNTPTDLMSPQNKEWTKFNDSPTSSVSSPGMKPVNFDFSAASVEQDPRILHPVAVRLSPDGQPVSYNEVDKPSECNEAKRISSQAIQRPIPRKPSAPAPGALPPPSQNSLQTGETNVESANIQVSASCIDFKKPKTFLICYIQNDLKYFFVAPAPGALPPPSQNSLQTGETNVESANIQVSASSFSGTSSSNTTTQNIMNLPQGPKKEPPPPPPPRPRHNHARSSSLDLNRLGKTVPHFLGVPPAVPPRMSPSTATPKKFIGALGSEESQLIQDDNTDFADFTQFDESGTDLGANSQPQLKSGAFEIYKKPFTHTNSVPINASSGLTNFSDEILTSLSPTDDNTALLVEIEHPEDALMDRRRHVSAPPLALAATTITSVPRDKREIQSAIRAHRERNMMLSLLNSELNQELSEIMEERIALEIQLEHIKPFS
ncbi:ralBP1-associated Eps domain-containing protein 1-like [Centruroides sculpturatus]|uniref:ralBP1-associated Eps domain-containing protein 1-like n=1 Tax=Centruroides sculpturatus TaxID=218467 RepID=UPI000C6E74FF|nr:ralBP1-associated Eps domain-containing protein 1-like [Centruroides sculpturatus]